MYGTSAIRNILYIEPGPAQLLVVCFVLSSDCKEKYMLKMIFVMNDFVMIFTGVQIFLRHQNFENSTTKIYTNVSCSLQLFFFAVNS